MDYRYYYERKGGVGSDVYSWETFIPFDESKGSVAKYDVKVIEDRFFCFPLDSAKRSIEFRYKFVNDSLYISDDLSSDGNRIDWGFGYSDKPEFTNLMDIDFLLEDWVELFFHIKVYITDEIFGRDN